MTHPVDEYVGMMVRNLRKERRITQQRLAKACGLTFQQIQKYEVGTNRVSASMLANMARFMKVPISEFFPADLKDPELNFDERELVENFRKASDKQRASMSIIGTAISEAAA